YYQNLGITASEATDEQKKAALELGQKAGVYYVDLMDTLVSSINTVINSISYVLIAFTAVSLVVSSIMIGIITYISVLERTKEIGILRSIGARKKDISRVFNAETLIIGFTAGVFGVGITLLLIIPINLILNHLVDIPHLAALRVYHGLVLIIISMILTLVAGIIPSRIAAKRDPVEALRSE
ncbi:MAG TPA: FtsX-like permease family protein, partial [Bacilli bacterium]|nr:FtsX-like permease family protein [Bacilli bacterium]